MNPLGWNSLIYNLGRSADMPLGEVSDSMLGEVRRTSGATLLPGDLLVGGLGSSRTRYEDALHTARSGADEATIAASFEVLASTLKATEAARLGGAPTGHVRSARQAAERVVEHLRSGIGPDSDAMHMTLWTLRVHLDQGWNTLGLAKLQGELRGTTSFT